MCIGQGNYSECSCTVLFANIYNLHCPDAEIKDTHPCQERPDVGNKTSLMASICMIWMDNCWIDHRDYANEMPS